MPQVHSDHKQAIVEDHQPDIYPGAAIALQGIFIEVIRARFVQGKETGLPWYWAPDVTPSNTENNEPGAPRLLYIESGYLEFPDAKNFRPSILIDAGETVPSKIAVANMAGRSQQNGMEVFWLPARTSIEVLITADTRGTSSTLAHHVWSHLICSRQLIRAEFDLQDMTEPTIGRTQPVRRDKDIWETQMQFAVTVAQRWVTKPIAPMLREIKMRLHTAGNGNVAQGAAQTALRTITITK